MLLLATRGVDASTRVTLQPVLCAIDGVLATGLACGASMPAELRVRTLPRDGAPSRAMTLRHSARDFHDERSERTFLAPRGPACCMYNTCIGEAVVYVPTDPVPTSEALPYLVIWPDDATIDVRSVASSANDVIGISPVAIEADQQVRAGARAIVTGHPVGSCASCAGVWVDEGGGLRPFADAGVGADRFDVLATADLDGDGLREVVVSERWRNEGGLFVLGDDWSRSAYRFNCGSL